MVSGRAIIEVAARMSAADLSILVSAVRAETGDDDVRLMTTPGSANDRLWAMMAERGWMESLGEMQPEFPMPVALYRICPGFRDAVGAVAIVSFEGVRQGMTPEEIVAFGDGPRDPRPGRLS